MRTKLFMPMLLTLGMLTVAQGQPGDFGAFASGGVAVLVSNKAVQEELKMNDEQVAKTQHWVKEFRSKVAEIWKEKGVEFGKGFTPPTSGQLEKLAEANSVVRKTSYKELSDILKKEQIERLKQIDVQNMGVRAFTDEEVSAALMLTDKQKASIKKLWDAVAKARTEIMRKAIENGPDFDKLQEAQKKIQKVQKENTDKAVAVLEDEQRKNWKSLNGAPFNLEKLRLQIPKKKD